MVKDGPSILYIARDNSRWTPDYKSYVGPDEAIARGMEFNGATVIRRTELDNPESMPQCDYVLYPKLLRYPSWIWSLDSPTVAVYMDYRPPGHSDFEWMTKADIVFTDFDDGRGISIPYPIWCDNFDHTRKRPNEWLWTGQKAGLLQMELRDGDVDCLPEGTVRYGWNKHAPFLSEWDYVGAIETHKYGLSVSHENRVKDYTSPRLGEYLAGGITVVARWFPGIEKFVHPDVFVYKERSQLKEFIANPTRQDPEANHEFARSFWDSRVIAKTILENL